MMVPLHVAAFSLLSNLHPDYVARFYFLLTGFSDRDIGRLLRTLDGAGRAYSMEMLKTAEHSVFHNLGLLHGSSIPYQKVLFPSLVSEPRLLYLDADVQVKTDVSPLFELDMGSKPAGFVMDRVVSRNLESKFLMSIGKSPDSFGFNSGVILYNIPEWRRQECTSRFLAFRREHNADLRTADQTTLISLFADDCARLDSHFNIGVFGTADPEQSITSGIWHYLGSPKPWDIGGRLLLPHGRSWFEDLRKTAVPARKKIAFLNRASWKRLPRILGGYKRIFKAKLTRRWVTVGNTA